MHESETPLCIIHKGIINDSSGTTLEELRESLEILFLSGYASVGDVRPSNPCKMMVLTDRRSDISPCVLKLIPVIGSQMFD